MRDGRTGLGEAIRQHGFRKWYERELLQSHAHLVLAFLCAVGVFGAIDAHDRLLPWADQAGRIASVMLCMVVGIWALRRYLYLLNHAEATANQADCPDCGVYARFTVIAERMESVEVCCRQCARHWTISG